jgi:hypothetical protein
MIHMCLPQILDLDLDQQAHIKQGKIISPSDIPHYLVKGDPTFFMTTLTLAKPIIDQTKNHNHI